MFPDFPLLCPGSLQCHSVLLRLFKETHCDCSYPRRTWSSHSGACSHLTSRTPPPSDAPGALPPRRLCTSCPRAARSLLWPRERACSLLTLSGSLLLSSMREALLTPKLKQRAFIPTVSLSVPLPACPTGYSPLNL